MTAVLREDFFGGAKGTTLAADMAAAATSLNVPAGELATWQPVVAGRIPFIINKGMADEEKAYAANVVGDTLTGITRGQDGTVAADHVAGATVTHGLFASHVDTANEFLSSPTAAGQVAVSSGPDAWGTPTSVLTITGGSVSLPLGTFVLPQATAPAQTAEGSVVWDTDDNLLTIGDGAGRKTMADTTTAQSLAGKALDAASSIGGVTGTALAADRTAWTAYTPTFTNLTGGGGSFAYKLIGKTLFLRWSFNAGTVTGSGGVAGFALPAGLTAATLQHVWSRAASSTAPGLQLSPSGGNANALVTLVTLTAGDDAQTYVGSGVAVLEVA